MNNDNEFLNSEKKIFGKIYTKIMYAINEISPFIDQDELKKRKYTSKFKVLKKYIELIECAEQECNKRSFLSIFKPNSSISLLKDYKHENKSSFDQLINCSKCQCLDCSFDCKFSNCSGCRENSLIKYCDKNKINVRTFDNFTLDLTNNDTASSSKYKVLGLLEDCSLDRLYIVLQNLSDSDDKLVLYYYPGIKEDSFGEITDANEFDFIVESYQLSE